MSIAIKYKNDSYLGGAAITPSNTVDLAVPISAIYVGGTGAIKIDTPTGETLTFAAVAVCIFPVAATRVYATVQQLLI